jgi:hypothetical protein
MLLFEKKGEKFLTLIKKKENKREILEHTSKLVQIVKEATKRIF